MLQRISSDKRKLIEDFANILQERVEIEETYAKGIEKLSNLLNNFLDKGYLIVINEFFLKKKN